MSDPVTGEVDQDELDALLNNAHLTGKSAEAESFAGFLRTRAGDAFVQGCDQEAKWLRDWRRNVMTGPAGTAAS